MRAIKFRVWDTRENYFLESENGLDFKCKHNSFQIDICDFLRHLDENCNIVQQFTGLKDHKNVECYEGDIVRYFNLPPFEISYGLIGEVQFINGCFCIKCRDKSKGGNKTWITEFDELDYFEVIGNIFETPELLK